MNPKRKTCPLRCYKSEYDISPKNRKVSPHDLLLSLENIQPDDSESWRKLQIIKFAVSGNVKELKTILQECSNPRELVNCQDLSGCTALHVAARFNQPEVAEVLLSYGTDCNKTASTTSTPLKVACRYQSEDVIRLLLEHGCDRLQKIPRCGNILHVIGLFSSVAVAELVFGGDIKPPVNAVDHMGMTPLHNAAQAGNDELCMWLINQGANPRAKDGRQTTPLMLASRLGHVNVIKTLLDACTPDSESKNRILCDVDDEGMGPLHHAVISGKYQAVQELLIYGADANARNSHLMTPLHVSALHGNAQIVPLLTSYLANLSLQDIKGRTPLHRAVELRNCEVIRALLIQGADPNVQDSNYKTALLLACQAGYVEGARLLCDHGASMTIANFYMQTCLHVAIEAGNLQILRFLLERCGEKSKMLESVDLFNQTAMHTAAKMTNIQFVDALINRGCSVTAKDVGGNYPLHVAARYGCYATVIKLAEVTHDINAQCTDGKSALFTACESGNEKTVRALIKMGANIKDTDFQFKSCLMAAATGGFTEIVKDLIERGVQVNYKDKERNTALHYACLNGRLETVKALLEHGASVSDTNIYGQTALDLAVDRSMSNVAVMLMEHNSWEESLSVPSKKGFYTLNRMIENTPAAVKIVLDKCVRTSDHASTDEAFAIEFNYRYINPNQKCAPGSECVFTTMLKNGREDLLSHPLCQSNLSYKWHTMGKAVFVSQAAYQLGYLTSIAAYFFMVPRPYDDTYRCRRNWTVYNDTNETITREFELQPRFISDGSNSRYTALYTLETIVHVFMAGQILKDVYCCFTVGKKYIKSLAFIFSTIINGLILFSTVPTGFEPCIPQWKAMSYALFVFFLRTSLICQRLDGVGVFFTMFIEVAKTMIKISFMMLFFILAMAIPFFVMIDQEGFRDILQASLSTFAMALGELNYRDNFINDDSPFIWDISLLFPVSCILLNCCIMNLMIGVAVGDISKVEKQAYLSRLKTHIYYLEESEKMVSLGRRRHPWKTKLVVRPNSKCRSFNQLIKRAVLYSEQISFIKRQTEPGNEQTIYLTKELAAQKASIDKLTETTNHILNVLQEMTNVDRTVPSDNDTDETSAFSKKAPNLFKDVNLTRVDS